MIERKVRLGFIKDSLLSQIEALQWVIEETIKKQEFLFNKVDRASDLLTDIKHKENLKSTKVSNHHD